MVDFETELKIARELFEKRLKTFKRIKFHLRRLSKSSDEYSAGEVALKVAETELNIACHQLERTIQIIRQRSDNNINPQESNNKSIADERDHFSEALDRIDPKYRLQLGR